MSVGNPQVLEEANRMMAKNSGKPSKLVDTEGLIYTGVPDPKEVKLFEEKYNLSVLNAKMGAHRLLPGCMFVYCFGIVSARLRFYEKNKKY